MPPFPGGVIHSPHGHSLGSVIVGGVESKVGRVAGSSGQLRSEQHLMHGSGRQPIANGNRYVARRRSTQHN